MNIMYNTIVNQKIKLLQENLSILRKIAGWSEHVLADKTGISKSNINKIENGIHLMKYPNYVTLRLLFEYEIELNKNIDLEKAFKILLDENGPFDSTPEWFVELTNINNIKVKGESI